MAVVETVRGPVDLGNLGQTLMHEHVFVLSTEHVQNYGSDWWDEEAMVARAIGKLNAVYAKGIRTIVDPTVWGLGRYIPRIQRIAAETPVNIVVAAGLYAFEELPHQYEYRGPGLPLDIPEPMVTDFARDITEGIAGTSVKAAFLKCCVATAELPPGAERIARAVARTHVETGAPVTVHTSGSEQSGRTAVRIFRGYAASMVLAHDANCFIDYFGGAHDEVRATVMPNWHYEHITDDVLPALLAAGVTQAQIDTMMVENPVKYFTPAKGPVTNGGAS